MTTEFTFEGKTHTIENSCIPAEPAFDALRAAWIGRANRYAQFYLMHDGSIQPASYTIDGTSSEACVSRQAD